MTDREVYVWQEPGFDSLNFMIFRRVSPTLNKVTVIDKMDDGIPLFKEVDVVPGEPHPITFSINGAERETLQKIVDELAKCGVVPKTLSSTRKLLELTERHLDDLRKAFKLDEC